MTRPGHHAIPFAGSGAGEHPCTWGQLDMWREMEWAGDPAHGNVVGGGFLPSGHTTDRLLRVVGELVERYESLRTVFRPSGDGRLVQRVAAAGELDVEVRELDGDPVPAAREWVMASQARPYDLADGVPFRVCVGTGGAEPRLVVLGMPHVTADLAGSRVLFDELVRGLEGRAPAAPPGLQPAERAAWERSDAGQRTLRRSLEYWRRAVAAAPGAGFAVARHAPESPRYRTGGLTTRAVPRALDLLAARYRVSTSHVLLAAVATLVGRYTGERRCLVRVVVGNRGRPELRNAVGTVSQEVAAVVDLRADRFGDMVRAARTSALNAMRHGQYDPDLAAGIVAEAGAELDVYFNDMWTATRNGKGAPGSRYEGVYEGGMDETAGTRFEWGERLDRASVRFFFESVEVVEDPAAVTLNLMTDTAYMPSPDLRAFLFAVEELLTALVADDGPPLDEIELRNGPGA